jgi:hypothetical protein
MMAGIGEPRAPVIKKYFEEDRDAQLFQGEVDAKDFDSLLQRYHNRRRGEQTFKNYLIEVLNLFKELSNNHNESQ